MGQGSQNLNGRRGADDAGDGPPPPGLGASLIQRVVLVRPGEGPALFWSAAYFFLLLFSYYLQRPFRDALGIRGDLDKLPWLWTGTTVAMLVAVPVFAFLVSRLPRRRFIPLTYRFFGLNLLVFYALFALMPAERHTAIGYAYYIWLSVFNLFAVSVFWGFIADLFRPEQGKRLFAFIAVGGTLGAVFGAAVPAALVGGATLPGGTELTLAPMSLLLVAVVGLELATQCVRQLTRIGGLRPGVEARGQVSAAAAEPGRGVWTGILLVARSPYLSALALYMLLFTLTSTFLWFEQLAIVKREFATTDARTAFFGRLDLTVNVLTLVAQVFITGRIMRWVGVGFALAVLPVMTGIGFALLAFEPSLIIFSGFYVLRRAAHYAVDRPSREVLYTVLGPEEKYKSKNFIDTFVYRGGDLTGAWTHGLAAASAGGLAAVVVPLAFVWTGLAFYLGAQNRKQLQRHARIRVAARCPWCGYKLAGLPAASCPECGGAITSPAALPPSRPPPAPA